MRNLDKYKGVIPAFYACYDENGKAYAYRDNAGNYYELGFGLKL